MDVGGYFLKFFDQIMHLPVPNIRELMNFAYPDIREEDAFYDFINEIRKTFSLTPRETPWLIKRTKAVWSSGFTRHRKADFSASYAFIAFLVAFKMKMPNGFSLWLIGQNNLPGILAARKETFIGQCVAFFQGHLTTDTSDLEDEISKP